MDIVTIATNFSSSFQYHSRHLILDDIDKPSKYLITLTAALRCPSTENSSLMPLYTPVPGVWESAFQAQGKEMSPNTFYDPSDLFAPA